MSRGFGGANKEANARIDAARHDRYLHAKATATPGAKLFANLIIIGVPLLLILFILTNGFGLNN